jgi:methylglutaconyl-CoA hydratase
MSESVLCEVDPRGVATITLNRPLKRNAFDDTLIARLTETLLDLRARDDVRVIILTGAGSAFSAGADLNWMRSMADYSEEDNVEDALRLAELMSVLNHLTLPTVARVNGHVFGGGLGLVACCDIAVADREALFALSEVRLGLVPAVISPYVIAAMGTRNARRFFLTGEPMSARKARRVGLIHEIAKPSRLDKAVEHQVGMLLAGGPLAIRESKELIAMVAGSTESAAEVITRRTAEIIAQLRVSDEGQEGLSAFLEKRPPGWSRTS